MKSKVLIAATALIALAGTASAQMKPEDAIKFRQSGYTFMAWNMGRIKANVEGPAYNKDEVIKAANAIKGVANSGMGALYLPGTDKGTGWEPTHAKPEIWTEKEKVGKAAMGLVTEANAMAAAAETGDAAAVKTQFGKLGAACKACHDDFRAKE